MTRASNASRLGAPEATHPPTQLATHAAPEQWRATGDYSGREAARPRHNKRTNGPRVTIILVSWNTRDRLLACLTALPAALGDYATNSEVIVVDNASSDATVAALSARFPDTMLIPLEENIGFGQANNVAIGRASGTVICLLNPDTLPCPNSLATLIAYLGAHPEVGAVGPRLLNPDGSEQAVGFRFPTLAQVLLDFFPLGGRLHGTSLNGRYPGAPRDIPFPIDFPLGACIVTRAEVLDTVGGFDPGYFMYAEEVDWARRVRVAKWDIHCLPLAEVVHFGGASTKQTEARMFVELHRARARYYRQHETRTFVVLARLITKAGAVKEALTVWTRFRRGLVARASYRARVRACGEIFRL